MSHVVTTGYNDPVPGTAWVRVTVAGVAIATFTYTGGLVTAPARDEVTMARVEFGEIATEVSGWLARVTDSWHPSLSYTGPGLIRIEHDTNEVRMRGEVEVGPYVYRTVWKAGPDTVILRPRDPFTFPWATFLTFYRAHRLWLDEVAARG